MPNESTVVFLDMNVLLHFKPLREIDWNSIASARNVRLVLCSPVLDELDEKKNDPRTAERARSAFAQLKQIENEGGQVRNGVTLGTITDDKEVEGNCDAAIIQRVLDYRTNHDGQHIALVSDDFNMRKRCEAKGVPCIELGDQWQKPLESEAVRKLRKAEQELQRLKNRLPEFRLVAKIITDDINPPEADIQIELSPRVKPAIDVRTRMSEIAQKYPKLAHARMTVTGLTLSRQVLGMTEPSSEEIHCYNNDLENFLLQYEAALNSQNREAEAQVRSFCFELWLENNGGAPGTDVEVCVGFPDLVDVRQANEHLTRVVPMPDPPEEPRTYMEIMRDRIDPDFGFAGRYLPGLRDTGPAPNVSEPTFGSEEDTELHLTIRRIKHYHPLCLGAYRIAYADWKSVKPFDAWFRVLSNELPEPARGKLVFKVAVSKEPGDEECVR